jgi:hypothetical protein
MDHKYLQLAYERTILAHARRHLEDVYVGHGVTDTEKTETMTCESVPYELREVPREAIAEFAARLQEEERRISAEMSQYDFRREDARPLAERPIAKPPIAGALGKLRRRDT